MISLSKDDDDLDFYDDQRDEYIDRTYEPHSDIENNYSFWLSLENDENNNESEKDDPVQRASIVNTEGKRTDIIALMKQMYEKTNKIEKRQINIKNDIDEIKQLLLSRAETLTHSKDLPKLPLQTSADSKYLEDKINREETQKEYIMAPF